MNKATMFLVTALTAAYLWVALPAPVMAQDAAPAQDQTAPATPVDAAADQQAVTTDEAAADETREPATEANATEEDADTAAAAEESAQAATEAANDNAAALTDGDGYPRAWSLGFQPAASSIKERIESFHHELLIIIFAIALFVIALIGVVVVRFRAKANPQPSRTTHNVLLEIIWTIVPVGILIVVAIPSFQLLFYQQKMPEIDMTLKVTGYQWYWGYEYVDHDGLNFLSYMIPEADIDESKGQKRLLDTDNVVVLPIDTNIRVQITAADVLHSWTIPAFGIKRDAVPGRLNESWFRIDRPGIYYGQCSEICGTGHAYMPIMVKAVTKEEFDAWLVKAKEEFASNDNAVPGNGVQTAAAQ